MLIADMNDLRAQQEDASKNSMLETESAGGKKEDATFLKIALKLVDFNARFSAFRFLIMGSGEAGEMVALQEWLLARLLLRGGSLFRAIAHGRWLLMVPMRGGWLL